MNYGCIIRNQLLPWFSGLPLIFLTTEKFNGASLERAKHLYAIIDESTVDGISCDGGEKNFVGSEKKNSVYVNILYYIRSLISK